MRRRARCSSADSHEPSSACASGVTPRLYLLSVLLRLHSTSHQTRTTLDALLLARAFLTHLCQTQALNPQLTRHRVRRRRRCERDRRDRRCGRRRLVRLHLKRPREGRVSARILRRRHRSVPLRLEHLIEAHRLGREPLFDLAALASVVRAGRRESLFIVSGSAPFIMSSLTQSRLFVTKVATCGGVSPRAFWFTSAPAARS